MNEEVNRSIRSALDACVEQGAPGAILTISAPSYGFSFAGASGLFQRTMDRVLTLEDPFRAASVSKAVTAAAALRLASQGRLRLDDPVIPFLPARVVASLREMKGLNSLEELTVRRLLSHQSGLPDYFFDEDFQERARAEPDRIWRPEELIQAAAAIGHMDFAPGSSFSYGDTGYVLVGMAIENIADCPLAEAYRSLIFSQLSMDATYLEWHEPKRGREVSHHYDGERDLLPTNTSFDWGGGGLVTTAPDLVKLMSGLFRGELFGKSWLAEMMGWVSDVRWRPNSSARYLRYGLGIGLNVFDGEELVGATGVWGAFAYYWLAQEVAIAGTVNMRNVNRAKLMDAVIASIKNQIVIA